ncbi:MAG: hypothetical protein QXI81_02545 [Nitrososphaerota archaeon]
MEDVLIGSPYQLFAFTAIVTFCQSLGHVTFTKPVPFGVNVV